jgi:hypothetical protein
MSTFVQLDPVVPYTIVFNGLLVPFPTATISPLLNATPLPSVPVNPPVAEFDQLEPLKLYFIEFRTDPSVPVAIHLLPQYSTP